MVENLSVELKNRRQEVIEERQSMYVIWSVMCTVIDTEGLQ